MLQPNTFLRQEKLPSAEAWEKGGMNRKIMLTKIIISVSKESRAYLFSLFVSTNSVQIISWDFPSHQKSQRKPRKGEGKESKAFPNQNIHDSHGPATTHTDHELYEIKAQIYDWIFNAIKFKEFAKKKKLKFSDMCFIQKDVS